MTRPDHPPSEDAMLDRLDAGEPPASEEEAAARRPYERVIADVAAIGDAEPPAGWLTRLEERRRVEMRPRRRWPYAAAAALTAGTMALAAGMVMRCGDRGGGPRFAMELRSGDGKVLRSGGGVIGDVVRASAATGRAHGELRIYRDTALVARCPGDPDAAVCQRDGTRVIVELRSAEPGAYRAIWLTADRPIPAPEPGGLEIDLLAAQQAGVVVERRPAVAVGR